MSTPTYWDYLKLDTLLDLQQGLSDDESSLMPDELHFIVVHQVFELWFKLILRELRLARDHLAEPTVPEEHIPHVVHHLRRVNAILKIAAEHFNVMETLTPQDFLGFRDKLIPSSGFQSFQMREIETLLGLGDSTRVTYGGVRPSEHIRQLAEDSPAGAMAWGRLSAAAEETSLLTALRAWLYRTPIQGSTPDAADDDAAVQGFIEDYFQAWQTYAGRQSSALRRAPDMSAEALAERMAKGAEVTRAFLFAEDVEPEHAAEIRRVRAGLLFIESYRELPLLAWPRTLIDTLVELEELLVLWRTRHARMVERIIGRRTGTGGSSGVEYLDRTTKYRVFKDLWAVRTVLLPKLDVPPLQRPEVYGFSRRS